MEQIKEKLAQLCKRLGIPIISASIFAALFLVISLAAGNPLPISLFITVVMWGVVYFPALAVSKIISMIRHTGEYAEDYDPYDDMYHPDGRKKHSVSYWYFVVLLLPVFVSIWLWKSDRLNASKGGRAAMIAACWLGVFALMGTGGTPAPNADLPVSASSSVTSSEVALAWSSLQENISSSDSAVLVESDTTAESDAAPESNTTTESETVADSDAAPESATTSESSSAAAFAASSTATANSATRNNPTGSSSGSAAAESKAPAPEPEPEPEPAPPPPPAASEAPAEPEAPPAVMVWIPQSGSKYHSHSGCSNMNNPSHVALSDAEAWGYTPCKKCY